MLLLIAVIGFLFVRSLIVPDSFNQYGWYRGDSVKELMSFRVEYSGSSSCGGEDCHKNIYTVWTNSRHKTVNCETCHGPSEKHVHNNSINTSTPANGSRDYCGICHYKRIARPVNFPQIDPDSHGVSEIGELRCVYCHNPHKPWFV